MEKRMESENKKLNTKLWIRVIGIALSVAMVAVICLGVALFTSNGKIAGLRTDLNGVNARLEALDAGNKASASEIAALKNLLALTDEELAQSKEKQESLENRLAALENANQSAQDEIDQLKNDIANAREEIDSLKAQLREPGEKIRIYIDQGHNPESYHNSGASGNGLHEQDLTFVIGCLLADLLRSDGRFEVQLSRPNKSTVLGTDNNSSLMARVEGAAEFNADYLISLHTNAFTQASASGIEVYVANDSGESYVFGKALLDGLAESTSLRNRGMKLDPDLDILEYSAMPAVLVEMGFISNSTDAALMSDHPDLFAKGLYNGILDYFGLLPN